MGSKVNSRNNCTCVKGSLGTRLVLYIYLFYVHAPTQPGTVLIMVTDEINSVVELLLQDLVRFQDRQHLQDPVRAKSKRRYVCGLREVTGL